MLVDGAKCQDDEMRQRIQGVHFHFQFFFLHLVFLPLAKSVIQINVLCFVLALS